MDLPENISRDALAYSAKEEFNEKDLFQLAEKYFGSWKSGLKDGFGRMFWKNGEKYGARKGARPLRQRDILSKCHFREWERSYVV